MGISFNTSSSKKVVARRPSSFFSEKNESEIIRRRLKTGDFKVIGKPNKRLEDFMAERESSEIKFKKKLIKRLKNVSVTKIVVTQKSLISRLFEFGSSLITSFFAFKKLKNFLKIAKMLFSATGRKRLMLMKFGKYIRFAKNFRKGGLLKAIKGTLWYRTKILTKIRNVKTVISALKNIKNPKEAFKILRGIGKVENLAQKVIKFKSGVNAIKTIAKEGVPGLMRKIGSKFGSSFAKAGAKGFAKAGGKTLSKVIPFVGAAITLYSAYSRYKEGDYVGAALEGVSGAIGMIPLVGQVVGPIISIGVPLVYDIVKSFVGVEKINAPFKTKKFKRFAAALKKKMKIGLMLTNPGIGLAVLAKKAFVNFFIKKTKDAEGRQTTLFQKTKTKLGNIFDTIGSFIKRIIAKLVATGKAIASGVKRAAAMVSAATSKVKSFARGVLGKINEMFENGSAAYFDASGHLRSDFSSVDPGGHIRAQINLANRIASQSPAQRFMGISTAYAESGNNFAKVSSGRGDRGGISFGRFQLSSAASSGGLYSFLQKTRIPELTKWSRVSKTELEAAVNDGRFIKDWNLAVKNHPTELSNEQITHSSGYINDFFKRSGIETDFGRPFSYSAKEVLFRLANQFGSVGATKVYNRVKTLFARQNKPINTLTERELIVALTEARIRSYNREQLSVGMSNAAVAELSFYDTLSKADNPQQSNVEQQPQIIQQPEQRSERDSKSELNNSLLILKNQLGNSIGPQHITRNAPLSIGGYGL